MSPTAVFAASVLTAVTAAGATACMQQPDRTAMAPVQAPVERDRDRAERVGHPYVAAASWTGLSLNGEAVTVSALDPPPGVTFERNRPNVVARIDKLARAADCVSLTDQLTFWRHQAAVDPRYGLVASAFAQHALDVAMFVGCAGVASTTSG